MARKPRNYFLDMPWRVEAPNLISPAVGIERVLLRGDRAGRSETVSILDADDGRLTRAGVVLAHRIANDRREWYVIGPEWQPWLPSELREPLGTGTAVPEQVTDLLRPFLRRAALHPVVSITRQRNIYALLDETDAELASLVDDRLTHYRQGQVVQRSRQVLVKSTAMTGAQRDHVLAELTGVGGVRVNHVPDLFTRAMDALSAPQMGWPTEADRSASFEQYLAALFGKRLRRLVRDDLEVRTHQVPDTSVLQADAASLGTDLRVLEPLTTSEVIQPLVALADEVASEVRHESPDELGDAYFNLLDALEVAMRHPPAGEWAAWPARRLLRNELRARAEALRACVDGLDSESPNAAWLLVERCLNDVIMLWRLAAPVVGRPGKVMKHLERERELASQCTAAAHAPDSNRIAQMSPQLAWQAGRMYQRSLDAVRAVREEFLAMWPTLAGELPGHPARTEESDQPVTAEEPRQPVIAEESGQPVTVHELDAPMTTHELSHGARTEELAQDEPGDGSRSGRPHRADPDDEAGPPGGVAIATSSSANAADPVGGSRSQPANPRGSGRSAERGLFIVFEGGDSVGKSTQARLLDQTMAHAGIAHIATHEPGATWLGAQLRRLVLDPSSGDITATAEALLYAADKAQHVSEVVLPALAAGMHVISDRYVDSLLAYQGAGRALDRAGLEQIARWATGDLRADLTVLLDMDPALALGDKEHPDRLEQAGDDFHQRVRAEFLELASRDPQHYLVLPARDPVASIAAAVRARLGQLGVFFDDDGGETYRAVVARKVSAYRGKLDA